MSSKRKVPYGFILTPTALGESAILTLDHTAGKLYRFRIVEDGHGFWVDDAEDPRAVPINRLENSPNITVLYADDVLPEPEPKPEPEFDPSKFGVTVHTNSVGLSYDGNRIGWFDALGLTLLNRTTALDDLPGTMTFNATATGKKAIRVYRV